MKLNRKILAVMLTGLFVTILVVGFFSFTFLRLALQESISTNQLQVAHTTTGEIDRILHVHFLGIQVVANSPEFSKFLFDDVSNNATSLKSGATTRLRSLRTLSGPWDVLQILDKEGQIVLSSREKEVGTTLTNPSVTAIFEEALDGTVTYSDFSIIEDTGRKTVLFASPIRLNDTPNQPIIGVAIGHFSWSTILQILEALELHAVLLNNEGEVIAANTRYAVEDITGQSYSDRNFASQLLNGTSASIVVKGGEGFTSRSMLASLAPQLGFLSYRGNGWGLVLETPTDIAFAPATREALRLVGIVALLFTVIVVVIMFFMRRLVVRPVVSLTHTAQAIASGNLNQRVEIKSQDEIGQLGDAFNIMTSKLKKSYEGLEEKVRIRTKELAESNKLKDLFIDIMRHDLLNPAGVVRTSTQAALMDEKNPKKKETLQLIENSSNRLIKMIENASVFAKLESGEKIELKEMDLGVILKELVEGMTAKAKEREIKITLDAQGSFPATVNPLIGDVIANFITNAIKYGPVDSEIDVAIRKENGGYRMSVADKGEGIPDKYKTAIFDRFTRLEKGAIKGTGLGLAIVKKIVELHNGKVWVEDNSPKGSVFVVEIPKRLEVTKNIDIRKEIAKPEAKGNEINETNKVETNTEVKKEIEKSGIENKVSAVPTKQINNKEKNETFQKPVTKALGKISPKNNRTSNVKRTSSVKKPVVKKSIKKLINKKSIENG